jgi:hypothetical protein
MADTTTPPSLIITRTPFPKWWKELQTAPVELTDAGTQVVIPKSVGFTLVIATIVLTVSGETNLTFKFGIFGNAGAMNLGGTNEPRGIVIAMGGSPASCGEGEFTITSDGAAIAVGGFVTYYLLKEEQQPT